MTKLLPILLYLTVSLLQSYAGNGGVDFVKMDFEHAQAAARQQEKFMLLDFTASWCLPCKKMDRVTFPDADLAKFVNEQFVSFKVNTDYIWGAEIAEKFDVKAYPTIMIIDDRGRVVKRIKGFRSARILLLELIPLSVLQ